VTAKTFDLVAIGEALIEFNQRDPAAPDFRMGYGGDTSNAVIAAARLGASAAYITQVGDDAFGRSLLALWQRERVDTSGVRMLPGASTGLYFVGHDENGHQFSYRRAGSAASLMTPADLPRALIADARLLHVSGISMAISASACDAMFEAVAVARAAGTRVSFDLNFRPRLAPAARALALARQVLRDCSVFFPSVDEIAQLTGIDAPEDILAWSHDQGAQAVVLKLGARGCLVSTGDAVTRIDGRAVTPVDATGAGDCFAGACLSQLATGASMAEAARFANVAAALSTQGYGAVDPLPRRADVDAALRA
jgi:2-dehydro-3-deoxygluconokinase